ncbi:MAG: HAMP domain-containing histidine kinase [Candidatus Eisenbacteria bacterium]|uniref:histidine kinase n=1 Tax=Eiseniibacteriota bacterium TaxID=2212470 RepID=A0A538U3Y1_UNCEI|nr:MAG: HAMP domain-containing histidine kinase [Candidatus Eisenbacteria bacterium]
MTAGLPSTRPRAQRLRDARRIQSRSELVRVMLFLASLLMLTVVFVFTNLMVSRLSEQVSATSDLLARLCAQASFPAAHDPQLQSILSGVIAGIDFPIVIADERGVPRAWRLVGLDPSSVPDAALDSLTEGRPISPVIRARVKRLDARIHQLDEVHPAIVMTRTSDNTVVGRLHYGDPPLLERLRWMPYVTVGGMVALIGLGLWGLAAVRRTERRNIWVGMALETAHQLGTPLSSLMGWIELLRSHLEEEPGASIPRAELLETVNDMEGDIDRLHKVAQRFSHVGSAPRLEPQDPAAIVRHVVEYMRRRIPRSEGDVTLVELYQPTPALRCSRELLEWAIENLIANAVSALDKRPGRIEVTVGPRDARAVEIAIKDNGRGMTAREQRRAFEPGYTTKPRGWGLGLALARRVVEEYHGGRLLIRRSTPGEGTTIAMILPL